MDTQLVRSPVYQQLNQRLRSALAGEYKCGDRFLTEREIAERFRVSRTTANKALASLVSEGFLEFRKGLGTFVRRAVIDYDVRSLVSFTEKAKAAGKTPHTELLTFGELLAMDVDNSVQTALGIADNALVWEMERVRLADDVPVIFEHRYVVHGLCPELTRLHAEGSLYRAWTETHGLRIAGANEVIRAVLLTTPNRVVCKPPFARRHSKSCRSVFWRTIGRSGGSGHSIAATGTNSTAGLVRFSRQHPLAVDCGSEDTGEIRSGRPPGTKSDDGPEPFKSTRHRE